MNRRPFAVLAAVLALGVSALSLGSPSPVRAQCLSPTACEEIRAEVARLRPDLRATRLEIRQARQVLDRLEPGSDRWIAKRNQLKRQKRTYKSLKRELRALQQDFRHQACSNC